MTRLVIWATGGVLALGAVLVLFGPFGEKEPVFRSDPGALTLPSGLTAEFQEMIWNQPGEGLTYRFRFVAEAFKTTDDVDRIMADLQYLCTEYALPKISTNTGPRPSQVIISLADMPSEFGQFDPDVTQVFEAFDVKNGVCMWELF